MLRNKILSSMKSFKSNVIGNYLSAIQNNFKFIRVKNSAMDELTRGLDLSNKKCLITGANRGIGLEVARNLNSCECNVLMACRNTYEASVAAKNVCKNMDRLKFYELNLASLNSVKNCSESLQRNEKNIDIVILNAATFGLPWTLTEDGLETIFQVNFLSQYYLLLTLEKILAPDARIVFTSSESHRNVKLPAEAVVLPSVEQLSLPKDKYTSIQAYNLSKLCGVLAMRYLHYRWINTEKSVFCAHPGSFVKTGLCRNWWVYEALYTAMLPFSKSITDAACTVVYCATSPELIGQSGFYFKDCKHNEESEVAKNTYFAFRIHDLVCDILRERNIDCDNLNVTDTCKTEVNESHQYQEHAVSNC